MFSLKLLNYVKFKFQVTVIKRIPRDINTLYFSLQNNQNNTYVLYYQNRSFFKL